MRWRHTPSAHSYAEEGRGERRIAFTSPAEKLDARSMHASGFLRSDLVSLVGVTTISGVREFLPGLQTPFHVQQGNKQHSVSADLVEHSIWEAPQNTAPSSFREE
jgi:hypothetical protein